MTHRVWTGKNVKSTSAEQKTANVNNRERDQSCATQSKMKAVSQNRSEEAFFPLADAVRVQRYFSKHSAQSVTTASVTSAYAHGAEDKSNYRSASVAGFLRLMSEEFWLASHPDNGAEPVRTAGGGIGVVHTADSGSTTRLSGGLAHTQL